MKVYSHDEWFDDLSLRDTRVFNDIVAQLQIPELERFAGDKDKVIQRAHFCQFYMRGDKNVSYVSIRTDHWLKNNMVDIGVRVVEVIRYDDVDQFNVYKNMESVSSGQKDSNLN